MRRDISSGVPEILFGSILWFGPLAFGAVEAWSSRTLELAIFVLFCASLKRDGADRSLRALGPALLGILVLGIAQYAGSRPAGWPASAIPFSASSARTLKALFLWAAYLLFFWSATRIFRSRQAAVRFAWVVFSLGAAVSLIGLVQIGAGNTLFYGFRPIPSANAFGPYTDHDHAAELLAMTFFMGAGLLLARSRSFRDKESVDRRVDFYAIQALIGFFLAIIALGIHKAGSRGADNAMILAAALVVGGRLLSARRYAAAAVFFAVGAACYGTFLWAHPRWFGMVGRQFDESTAIRLSIYRSGWKIMKDFPIWGVGLGAFQDVFPAYQSANLAGLVEHAHSDWMEIFIEAGAVGFLILAAGFARLLMMPRGEEVPDRSMSELKAASRMAVLTFVLHGFVDFNFQIPANAVVFLAMIAFSVAGPFGRESAVGGAVRSGHPARGSRSAGRPGAMMTGVQMILRGA